MTSKPARALSLGIGAGLLGALVSVLPWVLALEEAVGLQALFRLRGALPPPENVAVIAIAGESADVYGFSRDLDEWPRSLHASLISKLEAAGVAAIVMDIIFETEGPREMDRQLADAIGRSGKVVLLESIESRDLVSADGGRLAVLEGHKRPIAVFAERAWATAPFALPTVPFRVAQFWAFGRASDAVNLPVVALQAHALRVYDEFVSLLVNESGTPNLARIPKAGVELARSIGFERTVREIRRAFLDDPELGRRMRTALVKEGRTAADYALLEALVRVYSGPDGRYLNYYGPPGTIRTIPYHAVERADAHTLDAFGLRGKVVFVGFAERRQPEQQDEFISVYSQRTGLNLSGVEIGATAFANLVESSDIAPLSIPASLVLVFTWGFCLAFALAFSGSRLAVVAAAAVGLIYAAAARYAFEETYLWLPLVTPLGISLPAVLLATLFFNYRELSIQRERIQVALGRYVPATVAKRLASESFDPDASRELVHGTCLVSDAEHFTQVAESLDPEALHALMQRYFAALGACVERRGGFVADVSGDSMVAIWAAAKPDVELRRNACRAALEMLRAVDRFDATPVQGGWPTGIGLDSGRLLLGNLSAAQRYQYRAVGDIVNTASRIQGLNRLLGTRALVSRDSLASLSDFRVRSVGDFLLYGKANSVAVFELLGEISEADRATEVLIDSFAAALQSFRQRDWGRARALWLDILADCPADGPTEFYLRQCDLMERAPPPPDWTGTIRITIK
jgi:adenylate cyclase